MAKPSIVDEVAALIPENPGVRPWWDRVDDTQAAMLEQIREAWRSGSLGTKRRTAARAISATLKRHGVEIGEQGVETWLKRNEQ